MRCLVATVLFALALVLLLNCGDDDDNDDGGVDTSDDAGDDTAGDDDTGGADDDDDDDDNDSVWRPHPGTSWQWQLSGAIDASFDVQMYDIDLFETSEATIAALQADGRVVICYFSAGTLEPGRPDADQFPAEAIGNKMADWPEYWLDVRNAQVRQIMQARLDRARDEGCDGVEPDNVDGYTPDNDSGFDFTAADQLDYNRFIADEAHARGLSVGLKNDLAQTEKLADWFDWALNEECVAYAECDRYDVFLGQDKAVFHVEYIDDWSPAAAQAKAAAVCGETPDFDTLIKQWDLGPERLACP